MRATIVVLGLAILVKPLAAQNPATPCFVPPDRDRFVSGVTWPTTNGSSTDVKAAPDPAGLQQLLTGTYDLVLITTEGVVRPTAERFPFRMIPSDSAAATRCTFGACGPDRSFPMVAHRGAPLSAPDSTNLVHRQLFTPNEFDVSFAPRLGRLWILDVTASDGGGVYMYVSEVTSEGFSGRWSDAGMYVASFERDQIAVLEQPSGYFCAMKRQP